MSFKDEYKEIISHAYIIKKATADLKKKLEAIDNEMIARQAERIANAKNER
jgi:hypothetical protein